MLAGEAVLPHLHELAGTALTSHDVIVQSIAATTTRTGLSVHTELDTTAYPTGVKISDAQMNALRDTGTLHRHDWQPRMELHPQPASRLSVSIIGGP